MSEGGSAQARADELRAEAAQARARADALEREAGAWAAGAEGERRVAAALAGLPAAWSVVHDRLLRPGVSGSNLDHVCVGPAGVYLVDAKNWSGSTSVHEGNVWQHGRQHSPKGRELDGLNRMAAEMERALGSPVVPVIALAGRQSSRFRHERVRGVEVMPVARLTAWLTAQPTNLEPAAAMLLARRVEQAYPPASPATPPPLPPLTGPLPDPIKPARAGRGRRVGRSVSKLVVGVVPLLALVFLAPRLPALFVAILTPPASASAPEVAAAQPRACEGLTASVVKRVTGSAKVYPHEYGGTDVCGWHLTKPANEFVPPEVTIRTGRTEALIASARQVTGPTIKVAVGQASVTVPEHTVLKGWTLAPSAVTQPFSISLHYRYPTGATARQITAADTAARTRVSRLAEDLARHLPPTSVPTRP